MWRREPSHTEPPPDRRERPDDQVEQSENRQHGRPEHDADRNEQDEQRRDEHARPEENDHLADPRSLTCSSSCRSRHAVATAAASTKPMTVFGSSRRTMGSSFFPVRIIFVIASSSSSSGYATATSSWSTSSELCIEFVVVPGGCITSSTRNCASGFTTYSRSTWWPRRATFSVRIERRITSTVTACAATQAMSNPPSNPMSCVSSSRKTTAVSGER